jgi:hypothetical protein
MPKRVFRNVGIALVVSIAMVSVAAAQGRYAYCYSQKTTEGTVYVTPLFESSASEQALKDAFVAYLTKEHGYAPRTGYSGFLTCTFPGRSQYQTELEIRDGYVRNAGALATVVETDWTGPEGSGPASPPPLTTPPRDPARSGR